MLFLSSRKTRLFLLLNLVAAAMLVGFGPPKMVDREISATIRLTPGELQQWYEAAQPPQVSANAVLVYDVEAARTLYSRNADVSLPPASLTKLMTALLALESGRLGETVEVAPSDLIGDAAMGLAAGERVTVEELLWGLLIASGNDAAMALARHLGGDVDSFVATMNRRAEELGLSATHFANPHGLDAEGHVSSAADLLALTLQLLQYDLFREIVGTGEAVVANHALANTNEMLETTPEADGVKTGTTTLAGQCLVLSVTEDDRQLLIVVMGSDDRYEDARNLRETYRSNYVWTEGDPSDLSVLNRLYDAEGNLMTLHASGDTLELLRHRWADPDLVGYRDVSGYAETLTDGDTPVGSLEWRMGDTLEAQNELWVR